MALTKVRTRMISGARISVTDFGAVGDAIADDTGAFQAAIDYCQITGITLRIPVAANAYRITFPLTIKRGFTIEGDGTEPYSQMGPQGIYLRGTGSWIWFDHAGIGFNIIAGSSVTDGSKEITGMRIQSIGTLRAQPVPAPNWTPNSFHYDFVTAHSGEAVFDDIMIWGSYNGIYANGRVTCNRVRGQTFGTFIWTEFSADTARYNDCHFWPFWSTSEYVMNYMLNNSVCFRFCRLDNPVIVNCFSIWARYGMVIDSFGNRSVSSLRMVNSEFDGGTIGIYITSAVDAATMLLSNITTYGVLETDVTSGLICDGNNCIIRLTNFKTGLTKIGTMRISGTGNYLQAVNCESDRWDHLGNNNPAFYIGEGNTMIMANRPLCHNGGTAPWFGGLGTIQCPLGHGSATGTTNASGDLTVTHNLGCAPRVVTAVAVGTAYIHIQPTTITTTTIVFRFMNATGAPLASAAVLFYYTMAY